MPDNRTLVKKWIKDHAKDYTSLSALVHAATHAYHVDVWLDKPTHPVWEWAKEAIECNKHQKV